MLVKMRKRLYFVLPIMLAIALAVVWYVSLPRQFYDTGVSDADYISIARGTQEAVALLAKYPQAETLVDRSGRLAVDFRVDRRPVSSTAQTWEGIRLRVFIDPSTNRPTEAFLQCDSEFVKRKVVQYLEQYAETQRCP